MATIIDFPTLNSINDGVSMSFNTQLYAAESLYKKFTFQATSDGAAEIYPRLDEMFGLREWIGDRQVQSLSQVTFSIANKTFEQTIAIRREDIEDDRFGMLKPAAQQLGQNAAELPDLLVAELFANGHATLTYDGQNFFDTAHPQYSATGARITVPNYVAGSGPSWYLIDGTRIQKSFIFQSRRPFKTVPKFSLTDPSVFFDNEYVWGVDGRCNAGYGLWQLAYRSDAPLNLANLIAARTQMAQLRRPNGTPMGIGMRPLMLIVPPSLAPVAQGYATNDFDPNPATAGTFFPNTMKGKVEALENPWLS